MATHGMIDLETLGVNPDSVIMTLGAVKFDPFSDVEPHSPLYLKGDVEEQKESLKRSVDENTLEWWGKQSKEIQEEMHSEKILKELIVMNLQNNLTNGV